MAHVRISRAALVAACAAACGAGIGVGALARRAASTRAGAAARRIVIDEELVAGMRADLARRAGRPPSEDELRAHVDRYVDAEVLYREALALGLDRGDPIVRRRLIQKMELRAEEAAAGEAPTDDELRAALAADAPRYERPARVAFEHVFVARDRHADPDAEAAALLARVRAGASPAGLGDPFIRGRELPLSTETEVAAAFGASFARRVVAEGEGAWAGPIASAFGAHLVRVKARAPARTATLDEARADLARDVRDHRRAHARARVLEQLRARYAVEARLPNAK